MDPELFFSDFDIHSPISTGDRYLVALCMRLAESVLRSRRYLSKPLLERLHRLLSPNSLWGLLLVLAGWLAIQFLPSGIGQAIDVLLLAYGLKDIWEQVGTISAEGWAWLKGSAQAKTEADLEEAAKHFAVFLPNGGFLLLELILTTRIFRLAEAKLLKRFPAPKWLRARFEAKAEPHEGKSTKAEESPQQAAEREGAKGKKEPPPHEKETSEESTKAISKKPIVSKRALAFQGGRRVVEDFPIVPVVAVVVTVAAAGVTLAALASRGRRR